MLSTLRVVRRYGSSVVRMTSVNQSTLVSPSTPSLIRDQKRREIVQWRGMSSARHEFQAETKNLLDIVAKSLYSDSEVFVRELISNASDALTKRRCAELTGEVATGEMEIRVITDAEKKTIIIQDTGIGMSEEDLVSCLGTIAKSGSKEFIEKNKDNADAVIGQFGVGFYSAFMVADRVNVQTKKMGSEKGLKWEWNGDNAYEVSEYAEAVNGTRIEIHLKDSCEQYANEERIKEIINKYSYFVSVPVLLNGERVNSLNAIWTMNPKEVTKEMHETFFHQLAKTHSPHLSADRPLYTIHYKADSPVSLRSVMYVPSHRVSQLEFATQTNQSGINLYARRVLIKPNADLLPKYLRFVVGVVDSEDIPLNLSREMLQNNPVLMKLKRILTEKLLSYLIKQQKKDPVAYAEFYKNYALFFKEGVVVETEQAIKEDVAKLLMFESSALKPGQLTSFSEYLSRTKEEQKEIYYMFAPSRQLAENSPYFEVVKSQNKEVLFLLDPADEVVFLALEQFNGKNLISVEKWAKEESKNEVKDVKTEFRDGEKKDLLDWMKNTLGAVKVHDISGTHRPSEHPVMITVTQEMGAARHFLRMGEIKDLEHLVFFQPTLHVHLSHPLIKSLFKMKKNEPQTAQLLVEQLYDNALVTAGLLKDSSAMVQRLNKLLTELAAKDSKSTILTP